jgi:hypothetical protein
VSAHRWIPEPLPEGCAWPPEFGVEECGAPPVFLVEDVPLCGEHLAPMVQVILDKDGGVVAVGPYEPVFDPDDPGRPLRIVR